MSTGMHIQNSNGSMETQLYGNDLKRIHTDAIMSVKENHIHIHRKSIKELHDMKKIGLVGGTGPESTMIYYREINKRIAMQTGGEAFPEIAIESVNLYKALGFVANKNYEALNQYLSEAVANLEACGAELVALTAGTMHIVFEQLQARTNVPFISIPETVAEYAVSKGYTKVGLLGTIFTMEQDYLSRAFVDRGIQVVVPSAAQRILVNERISKELEYGIVKETSTNELIAVIEELKQASGIEAVILGCTELPLALNDNNCPVDCLDIMELHIRKLVQLMAE